MVMPVSQRCPNCGNTFMGSDCIGGPCPNCDTGNPALTRRRGEAQEAVRPDWHTRKPTQADVWKLAANDPIVKTVVDLWKTGTFGTWEEAMTALAVYLAHEKKDLQDRLEKSRRRI